MLQSLNFELKLKTDAACWMKHLGEAIGRRVEMVRLFACNEQYTIDTISKILDEIRIEKLTIDSGILPDIAV